MKVTLSVVCLIWVAALANGGNPTLPGPCPDFKPTTTLEPAKATNVWHLLQWGVKGLESSKAEQEDFLGRKCVNNDIYFNETHWIETSSFINGQGKPQKYYVKGIKVDGNKAEYNIETDLIKFKKEIKPSIHVIDTDYVNHFIGYMCFTDGVKHGYLAAVLGRNRTLPADHLEKLKQIFKTRGDDGPWFSIEQSKC